MRKEILDLYLFVFGLKKSIQDLRKYPEKYGDLWYKGNIIECGRIVKFLDLADEEHDKYIYRISSKSAGDSGGDRF